MDLQLRCSNRSEPASSSSSSGQTPSLARRENDVPDIEEKVRVDPRPNEMNVQNIEKGTLVLGDIGIGLGKCFSFTS